MCGIFGKINHLNNQPVSETQIRSAIEVMAHRGPDDDGIFVDGYIGLGMKRLQIIDITGGHQPIYNETGDKVIVFNGEIYNYLELRDHLTERGHKFKTKSDTEVILHLYEEYSEGCLDKLNGMFAFAIWDKAKKELFIARDRLGIKPLFYSLIGESLTFSSEIRPLIKACGISNEMDPEALVNYFSFYYVSSPHTMFKHIKRLAPGHYIKLKGKQVEIKRYWHFKFKPERMSQQDTISEIKNALINSVRRQLQSEVPLGVFLSSGLDSTSIVAMMSRLGKKISTYTIGYSNGGTYNELHESKLVAQKYGTSHFECIMEPLQLTEFIPSITEYSAEPCGDWTQAALYHLSKISRKDITVALSGAGGDELFAGYPTLVASKVAAFYRKMPGCIKDVIREVVKNIPTSYDRLSLDYKLKAFVSGADLQPERAHMRYKEIFSDTERELLLLSNPEYDPFNVFNQHLDIVAQEKTLDKLLYLDLNVFLPDCVLQSSDITTMMNSQECRVPFLDNEMIDLSEKIPIELKVKGFTTKYILRKALSEYLPQEIIKMPKKGLAIPTNFWLRDELRTFASDVISEAEKRNDEMFDFDYIKKLQREHVEGKRDNTRKLTCLISFFIWQRIYQ